MKIICAKALIHIYSFLLFTSYFSLIYAQAPDTLWTKKYGGSGDDWASSVQLTNDGGFIVVGGTSSFGADSVDLYLLKLNSSGDTLWTKQYGGSGYDGGLAIESTSDSGYIIVGCTSSYGQGDYDVWLIRINSMGDTLWTKTFGGQNADLGYSVQQISDSGFIVVGLYDEGANQQVFLIKTDINGDSLWTKKYGAAGYESGRSVQQIADGGFIITGTTRSFGSGENDIWLLKTDQYGDTTWTKTYGGVDYDEGYDVRQTSDTGYIITGYTLSYGVGLRDIWLVKTNSQGDTLWTRTYGGANYDWGNSVQQTTDGGFIIAGYTWSYGAGRADVFLVRTDTLGDTLWTKTLGYADGDWAHEVNLIPDGGYIVVGTVDFDFWYGDVYVIRITPDTLDVKEQMINPVKNDFGATIFSGPLLFPQDKNCRVFDIMGRIVMLDKIKPGIYFIEVDGKIIKKVVKVR
ncbi:MAG: T9SS type A sorting domain-containing protein [bacterium]